MYICDVLVVDFFGLICDCQYGQVSYEQCQFIVVDIGGIIGDEEGIDVCMVVQFLQVIEEVDVVFFLVDVCVGFLFVDQMIVDYLCKIDKKVFVFVNKVDGIDGDSESVEFYFMGLGDIYQIVVVYG